jgi:hypothetical protein
MAKEALFLILNLLQIPQDVAPALGNVGHTRFNCPYALVKVRIAKIGSVIRELSEDLNHLLWLDYDSTIQMPYLADVTQAVFHCPPDQSCW